MRFFGLDEFWNERANISLMFQRIRCEFSGFMVNIWLSEKRVFCVFIIIWILFFKKRYTKYTTYWTNSKSFNFFFHAISAEDMLIKPLTIPMGPLRERFAIFNSTNKFRKHLNLPLWSDQIHFYYDNWKDDIWIEITFSKPNPGSSSVSKTWM